MISLTEGAVKRKLSVGRLRMLCLQGRVPGAKKLDPANPRSPWLLPDNPRITPPKRDRKK